MELKIIAGYLVAEGANETSEANWSFTKEEIEEVLGREVEEKELEELTKEMEKYEAVAEAYVEYSDDEPYIDISYYDGYCGL